MPADAAEADDRQAALAEVRRAVHPVADRAQRGHHARGGVRGGITAAALLPGQAEHMPGALGDNHHVLRRGAGIRASRVAALQRRDEVAHVAEHVGPPGRAECDPLRHGHHRLATAVGDPGHRAFAGHPGRQAQGVLEPVART